MSKSYSEKLLDPRWQKKRLEILNRDQFKCRACSDTEKTLHVHHIQYEWGKEPWEYSDNKLVVLCSSCHDAWHFVSKLNHDLDSIHCILNFQMQLEIEDIEEYLKNNSNE